MPTTAATLTLNVPAITGLLAGVTISTIVNQISALGISQGTSAVTCLTANSANWQSTYTTVYANSANWYNGINSINSFLGTTSGNWQNTFTTVSATSATWQRTTSNFTLSSPLWNSTVSAGSGVWAQGANSTATVIANSGYWQNAYVTVSANQGAWGLNAGGIRGPYSVISTGTILPVSGTPTVCLNVGNYNNILGGLSGTNSGNYNSLVGGYRNFLSGGNFNYIGTGGLNSIGGFSTTTVLTGRIYDNQLGGTSVLSGNGSCMRIYDTQGGNFSSQYSVNDVVTVTYTTNTLPYLTAANTPSTCGIIQAVSPTNNNFLGYVVVKGVGGCSLDLSTSTNTSISATGFVMSNRSYNAGSVGSIVNGGYLNTASGNYSTVGGGLFNYALSGATIGGGARNSAITNSFIGGGCGNWSNTPGSVIAAGSFNKTGGNPTYTSTGTLSTNGACTVVQFTNINGVSAFNAFDPVTVVSVGTNGLSAGSVSTATVVGRLPNTPGIIVTGNYSTASCVAVWDRIVNSNSSFNTVGGGVLNTATGGGSVVAGGSCNTASGNYSSILGGVNNSANSLANTVILGSNITALSSNYAYVNNLSSQGTVNSLFINSLSTVNIGNSLSVQVAASASPILNFDSRYSTVSGAINKINLWGGFYGFGIAPSEVSYVGSNHIFYPYPSNTSISAVSAAMIISSTGQVGIGNNVWSTTNQPSPSAQLTVVGNVSAAGNITATGNVYGGTGITSIAGTTYTIQLSDNGGMIASTNTGAGLTATVVGTNYPVGFNVAIMQLGGSTTTGRIAVSGSSLTINQASGYFKTRTQYSTATLMYFGAPGWVLFGDLAL